MYFQCQKNRLGYCLVVLEIATFCSCYRKQIFLVKNKDWKAVTRRDPWPKVPISPTVVHWVRFTQQGYTGLGPHDSCTLVTPRHLCIGFSVCNSGWTHSQPCPFPTVIRRYHKRQPARGLVSRFKAEGPRLNSASALLFHQKGCGLWTVLLWLCPSQLIKH